MAFGLEQQFQQELEEMHDWAYLAEQGRIDVEALEVDASALKKQGKLIGILDKGGNIIVGSSMPKSVFDSLLGNQVCH